MKINSKGILWKKKDFTHLTSKGVHMVEVGEKPSVNRSATATGRIFLNQKTIDLIQKQAIKKGNVLTTAQIAAINAVKNTSNIIPLCHPLGITGIEVDFDVDEEQYPDHSECKVYWKNWNRNGSTDRGQCCPFNHLGYGKKRGKG